MKRSKKGKHAFDCVLSKRVEPDGAQSNFEVEDFLAILEFMDMVDI